MLTVLEIVRRSEAFLHERGLPNPRLEAELLIADALGVRRLDLYLQFDRPLEEARLGPMRERLKRRAGREPLQYILGEAGFCGLKLRIDRRALIPRPETEELYEQTVARLSDPPQRILDLGTGSGALALAFATRYPEAAVTAVDASAGALELAAENAAALGLGARIAFAEGDWWQAPGATGPFDLIVSNPPYLTEAEMASAEPEVADHEPAAALRAGADGLDALRVILDGASARLAAGGLLALETGIGHQPQLVRLAEAAGLAAIECANDLSGRPRLLFARGRRAGEETS